MKRPKGWTLNTTYQLGDNLPYGHPITKDPRYKGPRFGHNSDYYSPPSNGVFACAVWSKEYRNPRKGEWYLSGCEGFVRAYLAPNDLSTPYFIANVVLARRETKTITNVLGGQ